MKEIVFGYGNVLITPEYYPSTHEGKVHLQENKGTGIVGELTDSKYFEKSEDDIILSFKNIQGLDVMIERLIVMKRMMLGVEVTRDTSQDQLTRDTSQDQLTRLSDLRDE